MSEGGQDYRGHRITITDEWSFAVSGPVVKDFHGSNVFASLKDAKEKIDQLLKVKGVKDRRKLALPVLNEATGACETIHGIHIKNGHVLGLSEAQAFHFHAPDGFPDVQWIADLIEERNRLQARVAAIGKYLRGFEIKSYRNCRRSDADEYEKELTRLEQEWKAQTEKARTVNDYMTVVYPKPQA